VHRPARCGVREPRVGGTQRSAAMVGRGLERGRARCDHALGLRKGLPMKIRALISLTLALAAAPALADEAAARRWIDQEFQPSTLSKEQELAQLEWLHGAGAQLQASGLS